MIESGTIVTGRKRSRGKRYRGFYVGKRIDGTHVIETKGVKPPCFEVCKSVSVAHVKSRLRYVDAFRRLPEHELIKGARYMTEQHLAWCGYKVDEIWNDLYQHWPDWAVEEVGE